MRWRDYMRYLRITFVFPCGCSDTVNTAIEQDPCLILCEAHGKRAKEILDNRR